MSHYGARRQRGGRFRRRERIAAQLEQLAERQCGMDRPRQPVDLQELLAFPTRPQRPSTLLDEVTALVEWPVVYVGEFDQEFLEVPQECLVLTMQQNQKYFPLLDKAASC